MAKEPQKESEDQAPAPDPMPPAKRKRLQQCFERANELAHRGKPDFDYAHDLYSQAVANDPGNLVYVEALLENLQKKYGNNKKGSRFSFQSKKAFKEAVSDEDWKELFREGLELLKANPWDTQVLRELAKACAYNGHNEVELRYLKNALDGKPKDVEVNRHCAQSLARMGQFDMAIACWNRVAEKVRSDEPDRMISELTLAKTMGSPLSAEAVGEVGARVVAATGSPEEEPDGTPESTDAAEPAANEEDSSDAREIPLNARQNWEKAIREDPTQLKPYLELAAIHDQSRRYQDAEKVLATAMEAVGTSLQLQDAYEDAQVKTARARVAIAEQRAAGAKTEEATELVDKLRGELNRLELDIFQGRTQRFPDNLRNQYELAVRLRRAGNFLEAAKAYDAARAEPDCEVASLLEMGECWQQLKQYQKAMKCYQKAIEVSTELDGERRKKSLYRGAVLASAMKQPEVAKEWFRELVAWDADYRDAQARLDKLV